MFQVNQELYDQIKSLSEEWVRDDHSERGDWYTAIKLISAAKENQGIKDHINAENDLIAAYESARADRNNAYLELSSTTGSTSIWPVTSENIEHDQARAIARQKRYAELALWQLMAENVKYFLNALENPAQDIP